MNAAGPTTVERKPVVTVLIDTYNYGRFIEEAIDSVVSQDFPHDEMEVLVVDDGSEDDTAERVKRYSQRVRYLYKTNGGQASAFNLGLAEARGEIVAFLDGDDTWLPGKLRRVVEEFRKHPEAGMVYHRLREFNTRTGEQNEASFVAISGAVPGNRKALLSYILYPTSALAFRRKLMDALLPIPEGLRIQADAHLSGLIIFVAPIVAIDESLAVYRVHGGNLFHAPGQESSVEVVERRIATRETLIHGMERWLEANGFNVEDGDIKTFLMQWSLTQEADEFRIRRPARLKLFRHLCRYNFHFAARLSKRHMLVNYMNAVGSLVVGYERMERLDVWRIKAKKFLGLMPKPGPAEKRLDRAA
jgi:glycosyltransferase involved in cell wall biosynthesis